MLNRKRKKERAIKMSETMKRFWKNPEWRKRMIEKLKTARIGSSEKRSKYLQEKWKDPEWRKRQIKKMKKGHKNSTCKRTQEHNDRIAVALFGKTRPPMTEEQKEKLRISNTGVVHKMTGYYTIEAIASRKLKLEKLKATKIINLN